MIVFFMQEIIEKTYSNIYEVQFFIYLFIGQ